MCFNLMKPYHQLLIIRITICIIFSIKLHNNILCFLQKQFTSLSKKNISIVVKVLHESEYLLFKLTAHFASFSLNEAKRAE